LPVVDDDDDGLDFLDVLDFVGAIVEEGLVGGGLKDCGSSSSSSLSSL